MSNHLPAERRSASQASSSTDHGRRKFLIAGAGSLFTLALTNLGCDDGAASGAKVSGTPTSVAPTPVPTVAVNLPPLKPATLTANRANALRAAHEIIEHYARVLQNPSAVIHAVRAFGKDFKMADGRNAVDWLCANFAAEKTVSGQQFVYFPRPVEVHHNSFLKTFLEAGVSPDQPITVGNNKYTLKTLGDHAKLLFRCNPANFSQYDAYYSELAPAPTRLPPSSFYHEHLPWCLIAFSMLTPTANPNWVNAWGEKISFLEVIDRGVANYETDCKGVVEAISSNQNEPEAFRAVMRKHSCYGMHAVYGFFACLKHGYTINDLNARLSHLLDVTIHRLEGDARALDREFTEAGKKIPSPAEAAALQAKGLTMATMTEAFKVRGQVKLLGHAFEAINYATLHKLFTFTPEQKKRLQTGEQRLYEQIVRLRAMDLEPLRNVESNSKFVSDIVIALGHAARAMKLLTPENPDTAALSAQK
jgi:hypothetical protein